MNITTVVSGSKRKTNITYIYNVFKDDFFDTYVYSCGKFRVILFKKLIIVTSVDVYGNLDCFVLFGNWVRGI